MQMLVQLTANAARFILGGIVYVAGGGAVVLYNGGAYQVASECSGINSVVSISLVAFAYACFAGRSWRQWCAVLLAPVMAWCGNVLRVVVVVLCGGNQLVHNLSGYAIFLVVLFAWIKVFERGRRWH